MAVVEFSENLSKRYTGQEAIRLRALYRIMYEPIDIPYSIGGVSKDTFSKFPFDPSEVAYRLGDINPNITTTADSIAVGDIEIPLSEAL